MPCVASPRTYTEVMASDDGTVQPSPLNGIVHECRSELTVILSAVESIERYGRDWDDAKLRRYLHKIETSAWKLKALLAAEPVLPGSIDTH